jgi:hypothetical protein
MAGCRECAGGANHCVDGVCCNVTVNNCNGDCQRCNSASTAGAGTCGAATEGTAGRAACSGNLLCNGTSTSCPASCTVDTECVTGTYCDNTGACANEINKNQACAAANCFDGTNDCRQCVGGVMCPTMAPLKCP